MSPMIAIAWSVMLDAVKRKVVWVIALFAGLLVFAVPSLPSYDNIVVGSVYKEVTFSLMYVAALAVGLALACTRVPSEIEKRTLFAVLARDVRRWEYIGGTWLGIFGVVGIAVLAFVAMAILGGFVLYGDPMLTMFGAALAVWLETGVVVAAAVLATSRFGALTALVASLSFLFVGHTYAGVLAGAFAGSNLLPSLETFNVINPVAYGSGVSMMSAVSMLAWFAVAVVLLLMLASVSFASRDL